MRARRSFPEPFRFLDLPAELRNAVYELLTAEDEGRIWRFAQRSTPVKSRSLVASSTPASIFSLTQVCKELRKEFLSHIFAEFEVGLYWLDVEYFLHTVCATFSKGKLLSVRAPKSVTVYVDEYVCNAPPTSDPREYYKKSDEAAARSARALQVFLDTHRAPGPLHPSLNLLPLLKLKLFRKNFSCHFVPDPKVDWAAVKTKHDSWGRQFDQHLNTVCQDLARFMVFSSEPWAKYLERKLNEALPHPRSDWTALQIELVFKEQPDVAKDADTRARRCYMPGLRRAGLRELYATTVLSFHMSMAIQSPKPGGK